MSTFDYSWRTVDGENYVGGIIGRKDAGRLTTAISNSNITGTGNYVGGIVGWNNGEITSILAPIQSGNNRILKLMHRYSNRDKIIECFNRLKKAYPKLNISTQIIAGFPSETDEEFQQTLDLIKEADIDMGQIYPMSIRPNTPAVDIEPKVSEEDKLKRVRNAQKYLNKLGYKTLLYGGGLSFGGRRK